LKRVARSSSFVAGSKALDLIRIFIDNAIIGKSLGAQSLGYYSLGYNLIAVPEYRIVGLVTSVAFPALSLLQMEATGIGKAYLRILEHTSAVVMPLLIGLMLLADRVIPLVYGPAWWPAVPIIRVLCFAGLGTAFVAVTDSPLLALGKNRSLFFLNLLWVVLLVAAIVTVLVVDPGLLSIAYVVTAAAVMMAVIRNAIILRSGGLRIVALLSALRASVVSTAAMVVIIVAVDRLAPSMPSSWMHTVIVFLGGAVTYICVASVFFSELRAFIAHGGRWLYVRLERTRHE
jgi:O-antigen/teichoic acid export membrane protein